jgi:protein-S-isoprenylcysteine O-methyltransferase Ste14
MPPTITICIARRLARIALPTLSDVLLAAVFLAFARVGMDAWTHTGDSAPLLLVGQEVLIGLLALGRRRLKPTSPIAVQPRAVALAWLGTLLPLVLRPAAPGVAPLLGLAGLALQYIGGIVLLAATLSLGRSFGIAAANRGIRVDGLYRIVRHPMYAAYLLVFFGFALGHLSPSNVVVLVLWTVVQIHRALAEEQLLSQDAAYRAYQARVRYRFVPGVW